MVLKYKKEILETFGLLMFLRFILFISQQFNPRLFDEFTKRLDFVLILMAILLIAMYLPHRTIWARMKRFGKSAGSKTGKTAAKTAAKIDPKEHFGLMLNGILGIGIILYVVSLIMVELESQWLAPNEVLVACILFALIAAFYPYNPSSLSFMIYSVVLGGVFAAYMFIAFDELDITRYILTILTFLALPLVAWVFKDEKKTKKSRKRRKK